jgi:hypothetical protein
MANETRITTSYTFSSLGASFAGNNSFSYSVTGANAFGNVQTIQSGQSNAVDFNNLADVRLLYLKNQSITGNASVSLNSGQTQAFSLLRPGESLMLPPTTTGIWVSGQGAAIDLQVCANEA